jgi:hypothetical protein
MNVSNTMALGWTDFVLVPMRSRPIQGHLFGLFTIDEGARTDSELIPTEILSLQQLLRGNESANLVSARGVDMRR